MYLVVGCDCSASIVKCHTLHSIAYPLSHYIYDSNTHPTLIYHPPTDTNCYSIYPIVYSINVRSYISGVELIFNISEV